jgi:hypothetical protein
MTQLLEAMNQANNPRLQGFLSDAFGPLAKRMAPRTWPTS